MTFDLSTIEAAERRRWLDRITDTDPDHARLFCPDCVRYVGAAATCPDHPDEAPT